jgi:hypothetical protein
MRERGGLVREKGRGSEREREEGGIQLKKTNHGFVYSDKNLPSKYHRLFQTHKIRVWRSEIQFKHF